MIDERPGQRRLPSSPPTLPGFSFIRILGSGGFADVFLYEQDMPRRLVAVKVLLTPATGDRFRDAFQSEANLMARLSGHPSIVTIHQASVASDGRGYIVMEYCHPLLLQTTTGQVDIAGVLSTGVRLGSALESAHQRGILHRDIKPSNILTTDYSIPVLADFGIAATIFGDESTPHGALSIPWAAPEIVSGVSSGTVQSEIWSLAATLYTFLAGRSPFEVTGEPNAAADYEARVLRAEVPPIENPRVPATLQRLLQHAMAASPADRHASMIDFVHELQQVELELGFTQTPANVRSRYEPRARAAHDTVSRSSTLPSEATATRRSVRARDSPRRRRPRKRTYVFAGATLALTVTSAAVWFGVSAVSPVVPAVTGIEATLDGRNVSFVWNDVADQAGDVYQVSVNGEPASSVSEPRFDYRSSKDHVCVAVSVIRDGKQGEASAEKCVDIVEAAS